MLPFYGNLRKLHVYDYALRYSWHGKESFQRIAPGRIQKAEKAGDAGPLTEIS